MIKFLIGLFVVMGMVASGQARSLGSASLKSFLEQKDRTSASPSQEDYQSALRIIHVSKVTLSELYLLKTELAHNEFAVHFLKDVLDVQNHLQRIAMESKLHCRFALTNTPWKEVAAERSEKATVYAGCWASEAQDPLVKAGYDLATLQKIKSSSEGKDSIFIRR